jgi:excisionase family DNA binding protein
MIVNRRQEIGSQERWVDVDAVAAHLGVAKDSVYRWVESRGLPAHRIGRLFRFRFSEVDAWVAGRNRGRTAEPGQRGTNRVAEPRAAWGATPVETPAAIEEAIEEMVRRIVARFDPERIVLFGSHARGNADPDSDVDLLVVMPVDGSKAELEIEIGVALDDIPLPKDVIVVTSLDVERYRDVAGTIIRSALREGRTLYERAA